MSMRFLSFVEGIKRLEFVGYGSCTANKLEELLVTRWVQERQYKQLAFQLLFITVNCLINLWGKLSAKKKNKNTKQNAKIFVLKSFTPFGECIIDNFSFLFLTLDCLFCYSSLKFKLLFHLCFSIPHSYYFLAGFFFCSLLASYISRRKGFLFSDFAHF